MSSRSISSIATSHNTAGLTSSRSHVAFQSCSCCDCWGLWACSRCSSIEIEKPNDLNVQVCTCLHGLNWPFGIVGYTLLKEHHASDFTLSALDALGLWTFEDSASCCWRKWNGDDKHVMHWGYVTFNRSPSIECRSGFNSIEAHSKHCWDFHELNQSMNRCSMLSVSCVFLKAKSDSACSLSVQEASLLREVWGYWQMVDVSLECTSNMAQLSATRSAWAALALK